MHHHKEQSQDYSPKEIDSNESTTRIITSSPTNPKTKVVYNYQKPITFSKFNKCNTMDWTPLHCSGDQNSDFHPCNSIIDSVIHWRIENKPLKKWFVLINVLYPLVKLRQIKTKIVSTENVNSIIEEIKKNKKESRLFTYKNKGNESDKAHAQGQGKGQEAQDKSTQGDRALTYISAQLQLFQLIKNGWMNYKDDISHLLNKYKFVNSMNYEGQTPVYAACVNGNCDMVKFLVIEHKADVLQLYGREEESLLDIAVRNHYTKILEFLLANCKWPVSYIKKCKWWADNNIMKRMIDKHYRNIGKKSKVYCLCFS